VIQPEQADLLESPCALVVGSVDRAGLPDATRGWGLEVLDGGNRVRVLLSTSASTTIANARETRRLAITATHFATLVSVQVKGMVTAVEDARPADRIRFDRFWAGCVHELEELDGTPPDLTSRLAPPGIVAGELTVDEVYDQTPGPAAGARLAPTRS